MGVDTPDVCHISHYGLPNDIHSHIQKTGRGGRDGKLTAAVLLKISKFNQYCENDTLGCIKNITQYWQDVLFKDTDNYVHLGIV